ncbi:MAG: hypothetical protein LBL65_05500 [Campylobacteraceae bacterium]|jgi:hypothetical protein|nr:hypothetical protein [Campylobacteraceae bacterium]
MGSAEHVLKALNVAAKNAVKPEEENFYPPLPERAENYRRNPRKPAFGWVGGKSKLADRIISEFAERKTNTEKRHREGSLLFLSNRFIIREQGR